MYIFCPNCRTNFVISNDLIGPEGKKVRCSKCQHVWYQKYKQFNLPAVIPNSKFRFDYLGAFLVFLAAIFLVFLLYVHTLKIDNYATQKSFNIDIITTEYVEDEDKTVLHYKILNNSDDTKAVPSIKISLLGSENQLIDSHILENKVSLEPQQYIYIKTEFKGLSHPVEKFGITLGSKPSFILSETIE
jgi:predicted Zn finger-like uncharacterized protein